MKIVYNIFNVKSTVFPIFTREYATFFSTTFYGGEKTLKKIKNKKPQKITAPPNREQRHIVSDVLGSYTGTPLDGGRPEQDADDL